MKEMNNQEFQWTDALATEFAAKMVMDLYVNNNSINKPQNHLEAFKASKQKPLEYEILSFIGIVGTNNDCLFKIDSKSQYRFEGWDNSVNSLSIQSMMYGLNHNDVKINSLKRLSDNCIFSIGDETEQGQITGFGIGDENVLTVTTKGFHGHINGYYISEIKKAEPKKQPILITNDGVTLFEGDKEFDVDLETFEITDTFARKINNPEWHDNNLAFSTKEAAEEYVTLYRPCLSVQDVFDKFSHVFYDKNTYALELKQLAKQKINQ